MGEGGSQKLNGDNASVWMQNSRKSIRKTMVLGGQGGGGPGDVEELELRLDFSMACKK